MRLYEFFDKITANKEQLKGMGMAGAQLSNMLNMYRDKMLNKQDVAGMGEREAELFKKMGVDKSLVAFGYHQYLDLMGVEGADKEEVTAKVVEACWKKLGK